MLASTNAGYKVVALSERVIRTTFVYSVDADVNPFVLKYLIDNLKRHIFNNSFSVMFITCWNTAIKNG